MDTLITFGGPLKSLGNGRIGGYLVRFSDTTAPDLAGDYFDSATDFDMEFPGKSTVYYNHGLDKTLGKRRLGKADLKADDVGIWFEAQLEARDRYEAAVLKLVSEEKCGLSSGTAAHLVEREKVGNSYHIKAWPLGLDASITVEPCEPRTSVLPLKSFQAEIKALPGIDSEESEPGELLGDTMEEDMTVAALSRLFDALMGNVYSTIYNYAGGDDDAMTPQQKTDALRPVFQEFMDKALRIIPAILATEPPEPAEPGEAGAGKSVNSYLQSLKFSDYLRAMGAVVTELDRRVSWVHEQRAVKQGREFSTTNAQAILSACDGMQGHIDNLRGMVTPPAEKSADASADPNPAATMTGQIESLYHDVLRNQARALGLAA